MKIDYLDPRAIPGEDEPHTSMDQAFQIGAVGDQSDNGCVWGSNLERESNELQVVVGERLNVSLPVHQAFVFRDKGFGHIRPVG